METKETSQNNELQNIELEKQSPKDTEIESEGDIDQRCGFGCFSPKWIQSYATKRIFLVIFTILGLVQGMAWSYFMATITTLQKQFKISSQTTGIIMTGNETSQILLGLFISYFGGKGHRPRWISVGVLAFGLSCFLLASPQFIYGSGEEAISLTEEFGHSFSEKGNNSSQENELFLSGKQKKVPLCTRGGVGIPKTSSDKQHETSLTPLLFIFIGQFMTGIGNLLFFTLGGPYLDDNTSKVNMPKVMGLTMGLRLLGPSFGYVIASGCLKLFVNPLLTPIINQEDPRWVGAWWLGWLVFGTFFVIIAFLIALFPKKLRRKNEAAASEQIEAEDNVAGFKEMGKAINSLVHNKINLFNTSAGVFYLFAATGYAAFMPKYLENIFMQTASNASIISGTVVLMFRSTGMIISGILISKYKPSARFLAGWNVVIAFTTVAVMLYFTQLGCEIGTLSFGKKSETGLGWNLTSECNSDCLCASNKLLPVCHEPSKTVYFSACHAGCTNYENNLISNCTCIPARDSQATSDFKNTESVKLGNCSEGCGKIFILFLVLCALIKFSDATGRLGNLLVSYRCVDTNERSLSLGINILLASLFSFIPSPIVFGWIFDSVCLVWSGETEETKGNCLLYDGPQLRYLFNLTAAGCMLIGGILDSFVWYFVKDMQLYGESDTKQDSIENNAEN